MAGYRIVNNKILSESEASKVEPHDNPDIVLFDHEWNNLNPYTPLCLSKIKSKKFLMRGNLNVKFSITDKIFENMLFYQIGKYRYDNRIFVIIILTFDKKIKLSELRNIFSKFHVISTDNPFKIDFINFKYDSLILKEKFSKDILNFSFYKVKQLIEDLSDHEIDADNVYHRNKLTLKKILKNSGDHEIKYYVYCHKYNKSIFSSLICHNKEKVINFDRDKWLSTRKFLHYHSDIVPSTEDTLSYSLSSDFYVFENNINKKHKAATLVIILEEYRSLHLRIS